MSPLDWALIEALADRSGVPLEAVLRGIDVAFEKWRAKKTRTQLVNSLAFCAQAIAHEARQMTESGTAKPSRSQESAPPFRWKKCANICWRMSCQTEVGPLR